ncbi:MAG TPA: fatty acid desaturase [Planctomycetota bacterium]|nr:fatty acid desaturase [Planctomycetota bacterium]
MTDLAKPRLDWTNTLFLGFSHLMALGGVYWLIFHWSWPIFLGAVAWFGMCGLSITGGYHRLFSHPTYKAIWPLRMFYLLFGAASVQNSALKWSADHRIHHKFADQERDPYNINRGFWWAHIGWVLCQAPSKVDLSIVSDLQKDRLVMSQHNHYVWWAVMGGAILPALVGWAFGDPIGGVLVIGFLRLVVQWHATFSINSVAHSIGSQPYDTESTSRDSWITAILTLGEGYHNFHHRFQGDYRNGVRWYHLDPTKWFVYSMSKVGVTRDLRRVSQEVIDRAKESVRKQDKNPTAA